MKVIPFINLTSTSENPSFKAKGVALDVFKVIKESRSKYFIDIGQDVKDSEKMPIIFKDDRDMEYVLKNFDSSDGSFKTRKAANIMVNYGYNLYFNDMKFEMSKDFKTILGELSCKNDVWKEFLNFKGDDYKISYFDSAVEDRSKISYLDKSRYIRVKQRKVDHYDKDFRYMATPGKVLKKLLPHLSDSAIEKASNMYVSYMCDVEFKLVKGEDIVEKYLEKSHSKIGSLGTLADSCMKGEGQSNYVRFYAQTPDTIQMLYLEECGVKGRALIWTDAHGRVVMDRIYGSDLTVEKFKKYAQEQKWYYKKNQSYTEPRSFYGPENGYKKSIKLGFIFKVKDHTKYPYLDTFKFYNKIGDNAYISNIAIFDTMLNCTGGGAGGFDSEYGDYRSLFSWDEEMLNSGIELKMFK